MSYRATQYLVVKDGGRDPLKQGISHKSVSTLAGGVSVLFEGPGLSLLQVLKVKPSIA